MSVAPSRADVARAFGVTFGGSLVLDAAAAAALLATGRALAARSRPSLPALTGTAAVGAYAALAVPWMQHWGARADESPAHAVVIDAPPEAVWPWLAQIGQDRGGFYSYEWLENLAGCRMRNADAIHPEWQHRDVGDTVMLHWARGLAVTRFEPGRAIALEGWGSFELEPLAGGRTRLIARGAAPQGPAARAFYALLVLIPHFVMERRMLLGIKARSEKGRPSALRAVAVDDRHDDQQEAGQPDEVERRPGLAGLVEEPEGRPVDGEQRERGGQEREEAVIRAAPEAQEEQRDRQAAERGEAVEELGGHSRVSQMSP